MGPIEKLIEKLIDVDNQLAVLRATPYENLTAKDKQRLLMLVHAQRLMKKYPANDDPNWD